MSFKDIRVFFTDVDGVLTDNRIGMEAGEGETLFFHVQDGVAHRLARLADLEVVWISGRKSRAAERRAKALGALYWEGCLDKKRKVRAWCQERKLSLRQVAFVGDDLLDLPLLQVCGWSGCPADARPEVLGAVRYVSSKAGGCGVFRDCLEALLRDQKRLSRIHDRFARWAEKEQAFAEKKKKS